MINTQKNKFKKSNKMWILMSKEQQNILKIDLNKIIFICLIIYLPSLLILKSFEDVLLDTLRTLSLLLFFYLQPIYDPLSTCPIFISFSLIIRIFILIIFFSLTIMKFVFIIKVFLVQIEVVFSSKMSKNFHTEFHKLQLSYRVILLLSLKECLVQVN